MVVFPWISPKLLTNETCEEPCGHQHVSLFTEIYLNRQYFLAGLGKMTQTTDPAGDFLIACLFK